MQFGTTHLVGYGAAHGRDHGNAATAAMSDHLLGDGLRGHEDTRDVDLKHGVRVLGRVLQRRRLLLDTSRGNQAVQLALLLRNAPDDLVQALDISDVDLSVVESVAWARHALVVNRLPVGTEPERTKLLGSLLLHAVEIRTWFCQPIQCVHCCTSL